MSTELLIQHYQEFRRHIRAYRHSMALPAVAEQEMRVCFCIVTEFWSKPKQEALLKKLSAALAADNEGAQ